MGPRMSPCPLPIDAKFDKASVRTIGNIRFQTTLRKGLPISTPEQTFLDLAAGGIGLVDLLVVADGMIKAGHTSEQRLIDAAAQWSGRGCRAARRAASLARKGVDSPQETRLRLLLVLAGLPEPRVNLIIRGRDGSWRRRYDLAYEHLRLIIEYDAASMPRTAGNG
jgi:hypothetical protein